MATFYSMKAVITFGDIKNDFARTILDLIDSMCKFADCDLYEWYCENNGFLEEIGSETQEEDIDMDADSSYLGNLCLVFIKNNKQGYLQKCNCGRAFMRSVSLCGNELTINYRGCSEDTFWSYLEGCSDIIKTIKVYGGDE